MAAKSLGLMIETESLLKKAQEIGITKQGEMFSAKNLCGLANYFGMNAIVSEGSLIDSQEVLKLLSSGKMLLVP